MRLITPADSAPTRKSANSTLCSVTLVFVLGAGALVPLIAAESAPVFRDFNDRVQEYLKVRKNLQNSLPRRKTTNQHRDIGERQRAFAAAIRKTRANAKQGDIFTAEISDQFRRVIRDQFAGPSGGEIRKTIRQGEPGQNVDLAVNTVYPEQKALTTVPPLLLIALPPLPPELAYRIVDHDLVLQDTEARTIVDFIPHAIP